METGTAFLLIEKSPLTFEARAFEREQHWFSME
jgi:hypothetical protein